jgi:ATP-dependent Lon protease
MLPVELAETKVGARELKDILEAMPTCARLIRGSAHLLFAGSAINEDMVKENLQTLASADCGTGVFPLLSNVANLAKGKAKPFEVKLSAMGMSDSAISRMNMHFEGISDDDVRAALKKTIMAMPWNKRAAVNRDLRSIRKRLDEGLFGLEKAKQEVLAAIAGSLISSSPVFRPPSILLHGAPGTGKTAMAKVIAKALAIPFESVSMNGISTALSIVGLEPVWRSPQPGKIIQSMLDSKVMNPLILLDEIEKCGSNGEHGSPLDALLQALDPIQNREFLDLYMGIPADVSEVFFVATANDITSLPEHLLDRFIVIEIPEYTLKEKQAIMPYLLKQIVEERDLKGAFHFTTGALIRMEKQLLQNASLRNIKACLWRMLCEAALSSGNLKEFSRKLVIDEAAVESVLKSNSSTKKKSGIGFL